MRIRRTARRLALAAVAILAVAGIVRGQAPEQAAAPPVALLAAIEGPIGPGTVRHVATVVDTARERGAEVLILRLSTPGGLASSMREIIVEILGSPVPVIGYVAPPGAHAASAGTYILYAAHIAAMAPGTNIGAATPVQIGGGGLPGLPPEQDRRPAKEGGEKGEDGGQNGEVPAKSRDAGSEDAMKAKAVNDAVAFIRSLAEMHGRNADWAERAVREAATLGARQALEMNVINFIADDVDVLLEKADGRVVTAGSEQRTLATGGARVERVEPGFVTRALGLLSNPNVAFILLMIGVYGLIFEFANPGGIGPGVVGVICLVLGLYALNQLPLDYAGLALVVVGIAFMVAEAVTPTFGAVGVGGLIAFVVGAAMLIDTEAPEYQLSWWVIGGTAAASGGMLVILLGYVWRVYRRPGRSGRNGMAGAEAEVLDWSGGEGYVWARGERWHARGEAELEPGQQVRIRGMDGLTLMVGGGQGAPAPIPERARLARKDEGE